MDALRPKGRLLSRNAIALGIALLTGIGLGVVLDRAFIRLRSKTSVKSQIVGRWVSTVNEEPLEFNADGTYDWERYYLDISTGKMIGRPAAGQWRLLEDDWIEMSTTAYGTEKARVVISGDMMKLLRENGDVKEYRRK